MSNFEPPAPPPPPPGPPGGYGAPPPAGPPPGGGPYGNGGVQPYSAGDAFSYGWTKFQANMGQMILASLAIFIGAIVVFGIYAILAFSVLASSTECGFDSDLGYTTCETSGGLGFFGSLIISAIFVGIFFIFAQVVGAGLIREALAVTEGRPFTAANVFKFQNLGPVVITSLLVGAGVVVGTILCYIPGLIFGFFSSYSLYFLIDKNLAPVDAIKASFNFVNKNLGSTIIWYLLSLVIIFVGELACGVGLLVAIPVALVGTAYTYKKLQGEPIAA